jgi:hypothetical protein
MTTWVLQANERITIIEAGEGKMYIFSTVPGLPTSSWSYHYIPTASFTDPHVGVVFTDEEYFINCANWPQVLQGPNEPGVSVDIAEPDGSGLVNNLTLFNPNDVLFAVIDSDSPNPDTSQAFLSHVGPIYSDPHTFVNAYTDVETGQPVDVTFIDEGSLFRYLEQVFSFLTQFAGHLKR